LKSRIIYIGIVVVSGLVLGGLTLLLVNQKKVRHFNPAITLSYKDKQPYGAYVAYQELSGLFPGAEITISKRSDSFLKDLDDSDHHQVMVVVSPQFYASREEWLSLVTWVKQGNYLVIAAYHFNQEAKDALHIQLSNFSQEVPDESLRPDDDSLRIGLNSPPFPDTGTYFYPGRKYDRAMVSLDSSFTDVLGTNDMHYANLIHIRAGKGGVIIQSAPLAFSNYFLLYGNNIRYYESVFSVVPAGTKKVIWNEYYRYKSVEREPHLFYELGKLLQNPAFGPAFLILLSLLGLFILLEAKRRQRIIPEIAPKSNESMDFVKTIGRLYYEKRDHQNLAVKMVQHFTEYIRVRYQVQLDLMAPASVKHLSLRSGVDEEITGRIATFIRYVQDAPQLTEEQLEELYQLLESFYKTAQ
jgi:hypothetical protein